MEQILSSLKHIDLEKIGIGLLVLILCLGISRALIRLFDRLLGRSNHIDTSLHSVLKTMLRIVLYFISIMFAASSIGIPITSFLALFSVVGLAVSLAVQDVLTNLAGGVIILASKPFTLGDFVETDAVSGTVQEIGFMQTRMVAPDGKLIIVPNRLLYNSRLINYGATGSRRIDITIGMSYDCPPDAVRKAAFAAIRSVSGILPEPAPQTLLESYEESRILYTVRVWCPAGDYLAVRYALNEALYNAVREAGLEFTYPHVNVHMK